MKWSAFLQGVIAAAVGGAATSIVSAVADPHMLQAPEKLGPVAVVGAIVGVAALFKQSPIPAPQIQPPPEQPKQ